MYYVHPQVFENLFRINELLGIKENRFGWTDDLCCAREYSSSPHYFWFQQLPEMSEF